jgi:hypothetical protein
MNAPLKQAVGLRDGFSLVKAPVGFMLAGAIDDSYGTLVECIYELVQNAIDANAKTITVSINKRTRSIQIRDDGDGISKEKYETALQSVMQTMKSREKYGQFGRGMLSPLRKCKRHTLTSCQKGGMVFLEWSFATSDIESQTDQVFVPHRIRNDLRSRSDKRGHQSGVTLVDWQTLIEIQEYTADRMVAKIPAAQNIFDELVRRFRKKMLDNKISIAITILDGKTAVDEKVGFAAPYYGHKLSQHTVRHIDAGMTTFNLFLAKRNEKGALAGAGVSVGETGNEFRMPFTVFCKSVQGVLSAHVVEALQSGVFEGDIFTARAKLHHNRKEFEASDALLGFCESIETWYDDVGKQHYEAVVDARDSERYKALGEDLSRTMEKLLADPKFADFLRPYAGGVKGKKEAVAGDEPGSDVSEPPTPRAESVPRESEVGRGGASPSGEKAPRKTRAAAQSGTLGITFKYEEVYDDKILWAFEGGTLTFNILHSKWRACESSQRRLKQLQELICMKALVLEMMPEGDWKAHARAYSEELVDPFIHLLINSPNFQHISTQRKST